MTRAVTEGDNTLFSVMKMNPQPLHLDESFAAGTVFGTRVVNSLFTLSLHVGMSVYETTLGTTVAKRGFEELAFTAPVRPGDSVHAAPAVIAAAPSSLAPGRGQPRQKG